VDVTTANDLRETVADSLYAALRERRRSRGRDTATATTDEANPGTGPAD